MTVNANKTERWKEDVAASVDLYNTWFLKFAPTTFRETRKTTTKQVVAALEATDDLRKLRGSDLVSQPTVLPMLRMATAPPLARDRLVGLAAVPKNLVMKMDAEGIVPPRMKNDVLLANAEKMADVIEHLLDRDIFPWLERGEDPGETERERAASIVADRLCGAAADPIIRNEQERRQLGEIKGWLEARGYTYVQTKGQTMDMMEPGTFTFRMNVPVTQGDGTQVNIPVDASIMPKGAKKGDLPLLVEAKSAGDFTNTNKRRKEEAVKHTQLRATYGQSVRFVLFLCGYFDTGYLGYEAAEGLDWVWEHRIDDFGGMGL